MDPLSHVFLPLAVCIAVRPEWFDHPATYALAGFALLPDVDKFFGLQGLLHGLPALVAISAICYGVARLRPAWRTHVALAAGFLWSHLLLDLLQGNTIPWLYPFSRQGYGVAFPLRIAFGEGLLGFRLEGTPIAITTGVPRAGYGTFGVLDGYGVASLLVFVAIYLGQRRYADRRPH